MDSEEFDENNDSVNSSSSTVLVSHGNTGPNGADDYLNYDFGYPFNFDRPPKNHDTNGQEKARSNAFVVKPKINCEQITNINAEQNCLVCKDSAEEPYAHVKLDALAKLKDSTRKLICLLEEIQVKTKTNSKHVNVTDDRFTELIQPIPNNDELPSVTDVIGARALMKLESQAKTLDDIYVEEEEDNCSVYKRLTRKCHCLNQQEYNDFIIHFNENTKYFTSNAGEIIKNIRILKKFLYMGGDYGRHALLFLNEGLSESSHTEKVEITQGCAHADICNIFEEHSIVIICISWPCKYENYGNAQTQALTAGLIYKLAQLEEGRRYLKFSSKITNDLKKVIRKKASKLEFDTLESLNAALNLMHPTMANLNITYYCKTPDEGFGMKTVGALVQYRQHMTLDEVFTHLDILLKLSNNDKGKQELIMFLPATLRLFKKLLMEYDNSEMNIIITNILNNIVSRSMVKSNDEPKTGAMGSVAVHTTTEPILMKNGTNQIPPKKNTKKINKSKLGLGMSPNKFRQPSKRKVAIWEQPNTVSRSRKFTNKESRNTVIVVPIED